MRDMAIGPRIKAPIGMTNASTKVQMARALNLRSRVVDAGASIPKFCGEPSGASSVGGRSDGGGGGCLAEGVVSG